MLCLPTIILWVKCLRVVYFNTVSFANKSWHHYWAKLFMFMCSGYVPNICMFYFAFFMQSGCGKCETFVTMATQTLLKWFSFPFISYSVHGGLTN